MKVSIVDFTHKAAKIINSIIAQMNEVQNEIYFQYIKVAPKLISENSIVKWEDGFQVIQDLQASKNLEKNVIGIVDIPIENNWFSVTDKDISKSVITTYGWDIISHLNLESYLVMEITENLLEQVVCYPDYSFTHEPPIGCVSDMCMYKTDLNLKILTAYICPSCMSIINEKINNKMLTAFQLLFDLSRNYAFNKIKTEITIQEDKLIFPVAVYYRKLKGEPDIEKKFSLLLDLFDVIVRSSGIMLSARAKELDNNYNLIVESKIPSLGDWVTCFDQSLKRLIELNDNFYSSFYPSLKDASQLIARENLVKLRNDTKGHSFSLTPHEVNQYLQIYSPIINSLLIILYKFLSLRMTRTIKLKHIRNVGYEYSSYNMNTSNPIFEKKEFSIKPLENKREILETEDEIIIFNEKLTDYVSLYPYLIHGNCPTCGQPKILIIDYENKYLDIQMGHRIELLNGELNNC